MKILRDVREWLVNLVFIMILNVTLCVWVYLLVRLSRFAVRALFS